MISFAHVLSVQSFP